MVGPTQLDIVEDASQLRRSAKLAGRKVATFAERKPPPRTSNPFTSPEPVFDIGELLERIETVQRDSLKQSDGDTDILKAYLETQRAPKAAIEALEDLSVDQHKAWKIATGKIKKVLVIKWPAISSWLNSS